jgi:hypothetical protein
VNRQIVVGFCYRYKQAGEDHMRLRVLSVVLGIMLMIGVPLYAQDAATGCDVDLSADAAKLLEAQVLIGAGSVSAGLELIAQVQESLDEVAAACAVAGDPLPLDNTISSELSDAAPGFTLSVGYPETWFATDELSTDAITLANFESFFDDQTDFPVGDQLVAQFEFRTPGRSVSEASGQVTLQDALDYQVETLTGTDDEAGITSTLSEPQSFATAADLPGLYVTGEITLAEPERTIALDVWIGAVQVEGGFVLIVFATERGAMAPFEPTILEIARSVRVGLPEEASGSSLPETISLETQQIPGTLSVRYPADWVNLAENDSILLANSQTALDQSSSNRFEPGQLIVLVSLGEFFAFDDLPEESPAGILARNTPELTDWELDGPPQILDLGGREAAYQTGSYIQNGEATASLMIMVVRLEDGSYAVILAGTAPGEIETYADTVFAIAETVAFTPMTAP